MSRLHVLFDMDGVLVNSEPVITKAAIEALREYGIQPVEADFAPFIGTGEDRFIGGVAEKHGLVYTTQMKDEAYRRYLAVVDRDLVVYPGTVSTLRSLHEKGIPMALASSADRIKIDANLRVAGVDPTIFGAILSGDDVERKKPFPDIFLAAARALGADIARCVVIEDALNGVQAAKAAGARCIAVTTSFAAEPLLGAGADHVVDAIEDILPLLV